MPKKTDNFVDNFMRRAYRIKKLETQLAAEMTAQRGVIVRAIRDEAQARNMVVRDTGSNVLVLSVEADKQLKIGIPLEMLSGESRDAVDLMDKIKQAMRNFQLLCDAASRKTEGRRASDLNGVRPGDTPA